MKDKEKKKNLVFVLIIIAIALFGGIYIGMVIQQMIFIAGMVEFGESLEGTSIEVNIDLNETQLIEGFKKSLLPIFNKTLNDNIEK